MNYQTKGHTHYFMHEGREGNKTSDSIDRESVVKRLVIE